MNKRRARIATALLVPFSVTVAVAAGLVSAAPAQAAYTPLVQFTATVTSPDTATSPPAVPSAGSVRLAFTVTNTSNLPLPLGRIAIAAPSGFTLTSPTVSLPGWTPSIAGQTLAAVVSRPVQTLGILPGRQLTLGATALNATSVTTPTTTTWPVSATGPLGLVPFKLQGSTPTVVALPAGAAAFLGTPGTPLVNLSNPAGGSSANLPNGAIGNVYFGQSACATTDPTCPLGTEIDLTGDFGNLYSDTSPGSVVVACDGKCQHADAGESYPNYDYNYTCATSCSDGSDPYGEREVNEDFAAYPVNVELKGQTTFTQAPRCVPESDLTTTGQITNPAAVAAGFCVDVNAITRVGDTFTGDLLRPVLFVEDVKMR